MIIGAFAVLVVYLLLRLSEYLREHNHLKPEVTRKFIHITVGSFVAFWPFIMPIWVIYAICSAFIMVVLISRFGGLFPSIFRVNRKTWGDIFFPLGILLTLAIANSNWIFAVCMLHLSLADGCAALIGEKYGSKNAYKVLGYKKTIAGNLAFMLISIFITTILVWVAPAGFSHLGLAMLYLIPIFTTTIESISVRGTDNISVPVLLAIMLNSLQLMG